MTPLDESAIRQSIGDEHRTLVTCLEVFEEIGSTSTYLREHSAPEPGKFRVAVAAHQTAGRGRMDRRWLSPPGAGLSMSLSTSTAVSQDRLAGLTLAIGVCVARALEALGVRGIGLKWPNDVMLGEAKLGGILTETGQGDAGRTDVVVGIGINVNFGAANPAGIASRIEDAADLASVMPDPPRIEKLAGQVADAVIDGLLRFEEEGLAPFLDAWQRLDWLEGKAIDATDSHGYVSGRAAGIDPDGALRIETTDGARRVLSASVRLSPPGERRS